MKYLLIFVSLVLVQPILAQSKLPVIKATSKNVDINDDGFLDKAAWSLSPKARPDIYTADRTRKTKWVTFYTDGDSIRVKVKPGTRFNFIILLNGKDSCYTQIASAIQPDNTQKGAISTNDTIPFILTAHNAISVQSIINGTDTVKLHFDLSSFDFRLMKDAILKKTKLLSNQPDALAGKATPDYRKMNKVQTLQMGNIVWNNPQIGTTSFTADEMDGRFGWNLFDGKTVEINYDNNLIIIRSKLPKGLKGYAKEKLDFIRSFVSAKGAIEVDGKEYNGAFLFDTGADQAIIADSGWAAKQGFFNNLKVIKSTILHDPRGVQYETKTVLAPKVIFSHFAQTDVPTMVLAGKNPVGFEINYFGNGFLKRFNMIMDFKNDMLYIKPNKLMELPYKVNS